MDTAQGARPTPGVCGNAGERLEERHGVLDVLVRASEAIWRGPDAERFRADWISGASQLLREQSALEETPGRCSMRRRSSRRPLRRASAATVGGGSGAGSSGTASGRERRAGGGGDGKVSQEVADAGPAMDPPEQKRVLREVAAQNRASGCRRRARLLRRSVGGRSPRLLVRVRHQAHPLRGEHIQIDENHVSDPDSLNTVAHEARHAAQDNWVEETDGPPVWQFWREDDNAEDYERIEEEHGVTQEEIEAWRENDRDYEDGPTDPQPPEDAPQSEKDAWNEEYEAYRELPNRSRTMPSTRATSSPRTSLSRRTGSTSSMRASVIS